MKRHSSGIAFVAGTSLAAVCILIAASRDLVGQAMTGNGTLTLTVAAYLPLVIKGDAPAPTPPHVPTPTQPTPTILPATPMPPTPVGPESPRVYETTVSIPTYEYESAFLPTQPDDPIYPYPRMDFSRIGPPTARTYRAVVLENGYVSLTILPELGGRVYRWIDKATGRRLLYENPVVKLTRWG